MRLLPHISQPTLDTFRRDVYRPRLALLLLILLLSGKGSEDLSTRTGGRSIVATWKIGGGESRHSKSTIVPDEATLAPAQEGQSLRGGRLFKLAEFLTLGSSSSSSTMSMDGKGKAKEMIKRKIGKTEEKEAQKDSSFTSEVKMPPSAKANGAKDPEQGSTKIKSRSKAKDKQPAPGSVFYLPRPSLNLLLDADVLPAILPLHVLWIVRLGGMVVEDSIIKSAMGAERGPAKRSVMTTHGMTIAKICTLMALALCAFAASFGSTLRDWGNQKQRASQQRSLLPLHVIVFLELTATLLSLVVPLTKLSQPRLCHLFPRTVHIPSPSHSPGIVDLLPLPPGLADVLTGRASSNRYSNRAMAARRRQRTLLDDSTGPRPIPRHGALPLPDRIADQQPQLAASTSPRDAPLNPMRLYDVSNGRPIGPGKVPRLKGVEVQIELSWLLETLATLWGHFVGAIEYAIVTLSLPTLSPTSLPPVLSLLSLRSQLGSVAVTWTSARRSVECLEFVRRRWGETKTRSAPSNSSATPMATTSSAATTATATETGTSSSNEGLTRRRATSSATWRAGHNDDVMCSICFEIVRYGSAAHSEGSDPINDRDDDASTPSATAGESCILDCGHEIHAVCLVQWLTKQAFCPCCHAALSFSPPDLSQQQEQQGQSAAASTETNVHRPDIEQS